MSVTAEFTGYVAPWPPTMYAYLPTPVQAASEALQAAVDRLAEVQATAAALRAEADAALAADKTAARAAVETGKPVPAPTVPAALDAFERSQRALEAVLDLARDAQNAFVAAQMANLDETIANLHDRQVAIRSVLDSRLDEIASGMNELIGLAHVTAELSGGVLAHRRQPSFTPVRAQGRRRRDLGEEAVAPLRATVGEHAGANTFLTGRAA
jgi:hypothetical protein